MNKKTTAEKITYIVQHPEKTYTELAKELGYGSSEALRMFVRRHNIPLRRNDQYGLRTTKRQQASLFEKVKQVLGVGRYNILELSDMFNVAPKEINKIIEQMQSSHLVVDKFDNEFTLASSLQPQGEHLIIDFKKYKETEYPIGLIADTHLGSKYERIDVLNALYDRFASYGVKDVFLAGNMIDGEASFNKYDIYVHGVHDQAQNFVDKMPARKGITTNFLTGDDHEGWYVQREHVEIGKTLEDYATRSNRKDLKYIGHMERDIEYKQAGGSSTLRIIHAGGGSSYATSYTSQKYAESLQGGEKPQIVVVGHYHKFDYSYPRAVHIIQPGCTEDQTPFMRKRKLDAHVGGCVLWVKQNELGIFTSVKVEWIPFYDKKFYTYHW